MTDKRKEHLLLFGLPLLFMLLVSAYVLLLGSSQNSSAAPERCNVVVALDKSPSIGSSNLEILKDNIRRLVRNLPDPEIYIAFWTFSHDDDSVNYNSPSHGYVSTTSGVDELEDFYDALPTADQLKGQTDYAQAYGYSAGEPDINAINGIEDITLTRNTAVDSIRSQANVVVLLTDGAPNYPGGTDDNQAARFAGRAARTSYPSDVTMVGGYITSIRDFVPRSLNYVINGSDTDQTRVGPVSYEEDGNANEGIFDYILQEITDACNIDRGPDYWLKPKTNIDISAVREGDVIGYEYQVEKDRDDPAPRSSSWQIYDVKIDPEVPGNPLAFQMPGSACANNSGEDWCDSVTNCSVILAKIGDRGSCSPAADRGSGTSTFSVGQNLFYSPGRSVTVGDERLGTRICSVLVVDRPNMSGRTHRSSSAACAVVAKTPLVQVHGGDLRVGRHFVDDETNQGDGAGVYTSRFKISQDPAVVPNGRTFGSWVEYGVLAPGPIEKIASLAGFATENGGYDGVISTNSCDTVLNYLTFANRVTESAHSTECGHYKSDLGSIPDVVSALTTGPKIATNLYTQPLRIDGSSPATDTGRYEDDTVNVNFVLNGAVLEKGKSYIIYVPHGTVTIADNVVYANGSETYSNSDIRSIPQLVIIAKDVAIRSNVTEVNAWLIAAGDDEDGGKLDTCVDFTPPFSSGTCNLQLKINGPVMARDIHLWRTTVKTDSCRIEDIADCRDAGDPAEIFNLSASSLLWAKEYRENPSQARTTSTVELPPYF